MLDEIPEEEVSDGSMDLGELDENAKISPAIRQAVHLLHVNTGHRSPLRLARALAVCGAPSEVVAAARQLKCSVCASRKPPKAARPASLPPPREMGQQVRVDLVILEDALRRSYVVVHAVDHVSRYQLAQVLMDKSSSSVIVFFRTMWFPMMGISATIVADQGREFVSSEFADFCDGSSIYLMHIAVDAPWQNGLCERSGSTLKAIFGAVVRSQAIAPCRRCRKLLGRPPLLTIVMFIPLSSW